MELDPNNIHSFLNLLYFFFSFFCSAGDLTQDSVPAKPMLYP
jgi:hypothetical protein